MPYPLLGQDLLQKLQATITSKEDMTELDYKLPTKSQVTCPGVEEYQLLSEPSPVQLESTPHLAELQVKIPGVWTEINPPGQAIDQAPIVVQLTTTTSPIQVKQYPHRKGREKKELPFISRDSGRLTF